MPSGEPNHAVSLSDLVDSKTAELRSRVSSFAAGTSLINSTLKDVHQLQSELDVEMKPLSLVKGRLDRAYDVVGEQTMDEIKRIDLSLETVEILLKLASSGHVAAASQTPATPAISSTPSAIAHKRGPYKKRKMDGTSAAPSPLPSPAVSRTNSPGPQGSTAAFPRPNSSKQPPSLPYPSAQPSPVSSNAGSSAAGPVASGSGSAPRKNTTKSRKDALAGQLPLAAGRQVAFRQPVKGAAPSDTKGDWILARIVTCISGDKNRYSVEDVDYDPSNPTPEQGKYNTTLKSIIPLPDIRDKTKTYPDHDYPPQTQVMALYPDTTSFYRASIISGPEVNTEKGKKKEKIYRVKFEDDEDNVRSVPVELVVEIP